MIYVECNTDEYFLKRLGIPKRYIKHEGGKSRVVSRVEKIGSGIGVIDEDPGNEQPIELRRYEGIVSKNNISKFVRQNDYSKAMIVIRPKLEPWLIKKANENDISLQRYNLPDDPDKLHKINPFKRSNYGKFLSHLASTNDEEIQTLKQWLTEAIQ